MIKIALLGYGTIGSGVVKVLEMNRALIESRISDQIEIKYILDLREFPGDPNEDKVVHDYEVIVNDPEVAIVIEAMGGVDPAYTFARQALENGKHVYCEKPLATTFEEGKELVLQAYEDFGDQVYKDGELMVKSRICSAAEYEQMICATS